MKLFRPLWYVLAPLLVVSGFFFFTSLFSTGGACGEFVFFQNGLPVPFPLSNQIVYGLQLFSFPILVIYSLLDLVVFLVQQYKNKRNKNCE